MFVAGAPGTSWRPGARLIALCVSLVLSGCSSGGPANSDAGPSIQSSLPAATPAPTPERPSPLVAGPSSRASSPAESPRSPEPRPAGYLVVAGSHIGLVPPDGFTRSATFTGFEHASGASIVVAELPTGAAALLPKLTDEAFAKQGIKVESRREVTVDGRIGLLVTGVQSLGGQSVQKRVLVTGTGTLSAIINGNAFAEPAGMADRIEAAILTVRIEGGSVDAIGSLGFEITPAPPLVFAGTLMNAASYNLSGRLLAANAQEPTFLVAPSIDLRAIDPTEASVRTRLQSMSYRAFTIDRVKPIKIGLLSGFESTAVATPMRTSAPVFVYAVMLFGPNGGYVLMTGECLATERARYEAAFRASAATYRPKSS